MSSSLNEVWNVKWSTKGRNWMVKENLLKRAMKSASRNVSKQLKELNRLKVKCYKLLKVFWCMKWIETSFLEANIMAKHWFNMAAILKSKMVAHLVELVFTGAHFLTHNTHFDTKMSLLSLLEAKILAKQWFNMAAILKSKMAAKIVES